MSHTQGKLIAGEAARGSGWVDILDERGYRLPVAYATPATYSEAGCPIERRDEETIANARRLVACWNACEGISTEALESGVVLVDAFQREERRADIAERQRDELLAALEAIRNASSHVLDGGFEREATEWADALFECLDQATLLASEVISNVEGANEQP